MTEADARALSNNKKKRGVVKASLTRLGTRLAAIERSPDPDEARRLTSRLESLVAEFKIHHYSIIELLDGESDLERQQNALDEHDDNVAHLTARLEKLVVTCSSRDSGQCKIASKRLKNLEKGLATVFDGLSSLPSDEDRVCLLQQYEEQVSGFKAEFSEIRHSLFSFDLEDAGDLSILFTHVEKGLFDCSLDIKRLSRQRSTPSSSSADSKGVKLPKLDVPVFDGNIMSWKAFWEQFDISVHGRSSITDSEKLAYLRNALKSGSAKDVIEGLSRTGDHYNEAISCLQSRYNKPRLIHQAHVQKILEAPSLREGSGRELRRLHDVAQQHLRALKALGHEPSGSFITSLLELKLDMTTMFEWQRHSQSSASVPHYQDLLEFIDLRAQASEASLSDSSKNSFKSVSGPLSRKTAKPVTSFAVSADTSNMCVVCKSEKHPLYVCPKFRSLDHDSKLSMLRSNGMCINCMRPGHFVKSCRSLNRCKVCQRPHHSLLHVEGKSHVGASPVVTQNRPAASPVVTQNLPAQAAPITSSHAATGIKSDLLLMTCRVQVAAPNGSTMEARAILDSGSSASFVSEQLAQALHLPRSNQSTRISGVAGFVRNSTQPVTSLQVSSIHSPATRFATSAIVVPRVTCDLPLHPTRFNQSWSHLTGLQLADPDFGHPGRIDLLLGVEIFAQVVSQGRRFGSPGSPVAFETQFGWVLAGSTSSCNPTEVIATHQVALLTGDDLLRRFWEVEEKVVSELCLTQEEKAVLDHFNSHHTRLEDGRFMVHLPKKSGVKPLGESRSQAVRRFISFERSLHLKGQFPEFKAVIDEYFDSGHAEPVPEVDLEKAPHSVFYLPMHAVRKDSSTTTKVRAVFDASAKTSSGISLNEMLLVGPTVHSSLIDVLLRFRLHRVAMVADVSRMYRAIALSESDRDFHRFVWRSSPNEPLKDYRMTRLTFGVSASSFVASMCVKQNASDLSLDFPMAARVVNDSFYVDDGLTGADSTDQAIELHRQLQCLFAKGGFLLRKWNSSELEVLQQIEPELREKKSIHTISDPDEYAKTLGIEWNSAFDHFRLTVADFPSQEGLTKRVLASDIARTFDVLGWFSPAIVKAKILLQRLWEEKVQWDDLVPQQLVQTWSQWRSELSLLAERHVPRCYFPKNVTVAYWQLHGFCDASELAYAGVVYLRMVDRNGDIHTSLVIAKTRVAPIKRLSIPRLELCGAHLLAQLLHHCQVVFGFSTADVFAWTDSTIVLNWIVGNPRRFKTYVGNRVSGIINSVPPCRWDHVEGLGNPADCASRGMFPSELLAYDLWWNGPSWLRLGIQHWPKSLSLSPNNPTTEVDEICAHAAVVSVRSLISLDRYSSFSRLVRVTAWMLRFRNNCRSQHRGIARSLGSLSAAELSTAEALWLATAQTCTFHEEIESLMKKKAVSNASCLRVLHPFLDDSGLLRVGGRLRNSEFSYSQRHPVVLHGQHSLTKLIIRAEHVRLLHAGPTLVSSSLGRRLHIIGQRRAVRSITRACVVCRRISAKPQSQLMGQLPLERITPGIIFENVGIDYAGPVHLKLGRIRKPTIVKAYICVFVAMSVKAVHLELVSDLTTVAFIACLRRFIARRGKPLCIWSDHGSNFVGASRELAELAEFLETQRSTGDVPEFCASQRIRWNFIPERAPHFGGLWESAVKSVKFHLKRIMSEAKLTFEELATVLTQIEACLNSRPLASVPCEGDGIDVLTPGHFLIGRPLEALPDPPSSLHPVATLRRWNLCQTLTRHFWRKWSTDYFSSLRKFSKWHSPSRNHRIGDIVMVREESLVPTKWPLGKITDLYPGKDGVVRVVAVRTSTGVYKRPVTKVALLLPAADLTD